MSLSWLLIFGRCSSHAMPSWPDTRRAWRLHSRVTAGALAKAGNLAEAHNCFQHALEIRTQLAADHPDVVDYQFDLAQAYHNLGWYLKQSGEYQMALSRYRKATESASNGLPSMARSPVITCNAR